MKKTSCTWIKDIAVKDPDSNLYVIVSIYKQKNTGAIMGIDASFLETEKPVYSPFEQGVEIDIDSAEKN